MKRLIRLTLRRRFLAVVLAVFLGTMTFVASTALSDAGNPILGTIKATSVDNGDGTVTIYVQGQWNWLSHKSDCNTDRAGAGVGIIWNDSTEPGYPVAKGSVSAQIGIASLRTGDTKNTIDRMVHPSDIGNLAEGYPGLSGQTFNDPSPPTPSSFASWRSGCGREPLTATASPGPNPPLNPSGQSCANGTTDCAGRPWGSWGYTVNGGKGYAHTYLATALPSKVCVNFYDVHGGGKVGDKDFQKPNGAKEITVDDNGDNSIQTNAFNVNEGANCATPTPSVTVTITTSATSSASVPHPIHDTATLNVPAGAGGTITFRAYGPRAFNSTTANCSGTPAFVSAPVNVNGPGTYDSPDFMATQAGLYDWTATYSGDPSKSVPGVASPCGAANETSTVGSNRATPTLTTDASPLTVSTVGGSANLTDMATLANATSNATGTITFTLYSGSSCQTLVGTTTNNTVNGNGSYSSPPITVPHGVYHWIASYSGDPNNNPATTACGDANENVTVEFGS
jgi:hypothetical protein